jgi:hypothetical protein
MWWFFYHLPDALFRLCTLNYLQLPHRKSEHVALRLVNKLGMTPSPWACGSSAGTQVGGYMLVLRAAPWLVHHDMHWRGGTEQRQGAQKGYLCQKASSRRSTSGTRHKGGGATEERAVMWWWSQGSRAAGVLPGGLAEQACYSICHLRPRPWPACSAALLNNYVQVPLSSIPGNLCNPSTYLFVSLGKYLLNQPNGRERVVARDGVALMTCAYVWHHDNRTSVWKALILVSGVKYISY